MALDIVTGAFGFVGRFITERLLDDGRLVKTLTGHPGRTHPLADRIEVARLDFSDPGHLARELDGVDTLYNTYWVRFARGRLNHRVAAENSETLLRAAAAAGVRRVVHISITRPCEAPHLPYFAGKCRVERALADSGLSHAVVRPAFVFGPGALLINNIAWALRRFPLFPLAGGGNYLVQPIHVADLADLAVAAAQGEENVAFDATGPESYTFDELVRMVGEAVGSRARMLYLPPTAVLALTSLAGLLMPVIPALWGG